MATETRPVKAKKAKQLVAPTDRVTKKLFDRIENSRFYDNLNQLQDVWVGDKDREPVSVLVSIDTEDLKKHVALSEDTMLNPYNRAVHNAVISLYSEGNSHFTEDMIYRLMNGYRRIDKIPDGARKSIHEAISSLMYTGIKINATNEAKAFSIQEFTYKGYVLPLTYTRAKINGEVRECWKILDKPPLLALAERKNQINRGNVKYLDTGLNFTPENIILTNYLVEQVLNMQNKKSNRNNTILYDTVYTFLGVDAPKVSTVETKHRRIRNKIKAILDAWVQSGLIKNYGEFLEGRKILGVHIKYKKHTK